MFKVFPKGMVVLNSVKFETRSIVQIECHLKRMHEADNLFYRHKLSNVSQNMIEKKCRVFGPQVQYSRV